MAVRSGDPEALHLYQLIGAPLLAVVQAEAQAAQTSADFMKRVGFENRQIDSAQGALQDGGDIGNLKMAEFSIERVTPEGKLQPHLVRVPVLSMFPIPLLQVKHAEFDFDVRVLTRVPMQTPAQDDANGDRSPSKDYLAPDRVELKGFLAPSSNNGQRATEANIKVKVRMEQSDLPAGLLRLLSIMDQNVSAQPAVPRQQLAPNEERTHG